ncbi:MAG: HNH endonuclease [Planctomycetaceae bacterium]|nr:HNH endonuclease [Planctomycetaceae bacterium]
MARRIRIASVESLISDLDRKLTELSVDLTGLTLRQKVLQLVEVHYQSRCLGVSIVVADGLSPSAAMDRIQVYLQRHVGQVIDGAELDVVSGISEYARRVRELRVERGFRILSGASPDEESGVVLKHDQYVLISEHVDSDLARRWHVANRIRKGTGGAKAKILQFLKENVGKVVTTEELAYVSGDKSEFGRRTRELRTEEGYAVATRFTGRPDLNAGEYVLLSIERVAEPHDRHIPSDVQRAVYERDNSTCQHCGWNMSMWSVADPRILELHHVTAHAKRGANDLENLIVLCSYCHDEVHAGRLKLRKKLK